VFTVGQAMTAALQVFADRAVWRRSVHDGGEDEGEITKFAMVAAEACGGVVGCHQSF
jgi:hypothetical protein